MLDEGVRRIDALYVQALGEGRLRPDPSLLIEEPVAPPPDLVASDEGDPLASLVSTIAGPGASPADAANASAAKLTVQVETADVAVLDQAQTALRGVAGVQQASVASLALGGTSLLTLSYAGDINALRAALAARGWRLEGTGATLRMRRAGAAPMPVPPPAGQPKP